jgi:thioredoxin reductase (NADPH)
LQAVAFPTLDEAQVATLGSCAGAPLTKYRAGQTLFRCGDRDAKFFIIKSGQVEIRDETGDAPRVVVVHKPGGFTGEAGQLTGRPTVVTAVAQTDSEVYPVSPDALREILNRCPDLGDVILQAFIARQQLLRQSAGFTGLRVIGSRYSRDTFRIRDFLARNRIWFTWLDLESDPQVNQLLKQFGVTEADTPVVACGHMLLLRNPSNRALAEAIGIRKPLDQQVYDLVVVGGGPAGLAVAVYGASEGLSTLVLECTAPGGQAGSSMRIENYLGFPTGLTGRELLPRQESFASLHILTRRASEGSEALPSLARRVRMSFFGARVITDRAVLQANKFGARLSVSGPVTGLTFDNAYAVLHLDGSESVVAKCLLITTGAEYRRLGVEGCEQFEGCGVYYAATPNEAQMCRGADVVVVGGGNSAGQAAVFLAGQSRKVFVLIRGDDLYKNMSSYLARRLEETGNIEVLLNTEVKRMSGDLRLTTIEIVNSKTGQTQVLEAAALFSFIGAVPRTDWLPKEIEIDSKGFVSTGPALAQSPTWGAKRPPFLLETSRPGVFAAGDVRSGSVKRVASAVGEGAMAVQFVHEYLKEM